MMKGSRKLRNDDKEVLIALTKVVSFIVIFSMIFIFIAWMMSEKVEARPLSADKKAFEEAQAKKYLVSERTKLVSAARGKSVIALNVSHAGQ